MLVVFELLLDTSYNTSHSSLGNQSESFFVVDILGLYVHEELSFSHV